jgi:imidazole glycerol-phosphate synthase subunit HisH
LSFGPKDGVEGFRPIYCRFDRNKAFSMIVIADYGVGNLKSVERMMGKAGCNAKLSSSADELSAADRVILPGVGNFGECARRLRAAPFFEALLDFALVRKKPVLGICVGAQLLGHSSEEAPAEKGLGWIDMVCRKFPDRADYRVPNIGWNTIQPTRPSPLLANLNDESRFYFVHSFHFECASKDDVLATANYGFDYPCVVGRENLFGMQFHPEKSLRHGMSMLKTFAEL